MTNHTTTITTRIWHLSDLAHMAGSDTTHAEAEAFRDLLIERDFLSWTSDRDGGALTCTDDEFYQALEDASYALLKACDDLA